jgi:hypothetical protein
MNENTWTSRWSTQEVYYYATPSGYEVDFYLPEKRQLIQVTQNLEIAATREREIRALKDAITGVQVESALILSNANEKPGNRGRKSRNPFSCRMVAQSINRIEMYLRMKLINHHRIKGVSFHSVNYFY